VTFLCVLPIYTDTTIIIFYNISEEELDPDGTTTQTVAKPTVLYTEGRTEGN